MKPLNITIILILAILVTTACKPPRKGDLVCQDTPVGEICTQKWKWPVFSVQSLTPSFGASLSSSFDVSLFSVDLSSSNVPIHTTSGYATVTLGLFGGSKQSSSFEWIRIGDEAIASHPTLVNGWVDQYSGDIETIDVQFDFGVGSIDGVNLVVSELKYGTSVIAGSSYSWYSGGDGSCGASCQAN